MSKKQDQLVKVFEKLVADLECIDAKPEDEVIEVGESLARAASSIEGIGDKNVSVGLLRRLAQSLIAGVAKSCRK